MTLILAENIPIFSSKTTNIMSYQSIRNKVLARIRGHGRGYVFSAHDFLDLATRRTVDQGLARLVDQQAIRRLGRGLYDYPRRSAKIGMLSPSPDAVARAIARKTGTRIEKSGPEAANLLGLSRQVPAHLTFYTDGPTRTIRIGRQIIRFRHKSPRKLDTHETTASAVIHALEYVKKENITPSDVERLATMLSDEDKIRLRELRRRAPTWMHDLILQIVLPNHE